MIIEIKEKEYNGKSIMDLEVDRFISLLNINKSEGDGVEKALNSLIYLTDIPIEILEEISVRYIVSLYEKLTFIDISEDNGGDIVITRKIYNELKSVMSESNFDWIIRIPEIFGKEEGDMITFRDFLPYIIAIIKEFAEDINESLGEFINMSGNYEKNEQLVK